ncbi:MAG: beta-N-acetylhexosaminidase [Bacteroidota bacterium]
MNRNMKHYWLLGIVLSLFLVFTSCSKDLKKKYADTSLDVNIIPKPEMLTSKKGVFVITENTGINISEQDAKAASVANLFMAGINQASGFDLKLGTKDENINLVINKNLKELGPEGYKLDVSQNKIVIEAYEAAGLFYGTQTILQMLPSAAQSSTIIKNAEWIVPCVSIEDKPRFSWRGYMKDVSRTFYSVDVVKKYLDVMALYKMNVFHFHLTDDQGWRIEIKNYPKLTTPQTTIFHESYNEPTERSGFYTQEQIIDLVQYAAERNITIVPEIDLPGHSWPALLAYPELSVNQKTNPPYVFPFLASWAYWGNQRTPNTFDPTNEEVYKFLDVIFEEVCSIFPSEYIHFGGDEVKFSVWDEAEHVQQFIKKQGLKSNKDLQSLFVARVCDIIKSKGRKPIGWNDILEGDHEPLQGAAIMSWLGEHAIKEAAENGFYTVATPAGYTYLDICQADRNDGTMSDLGYSHINSIEKIYNYEPTHGLDSIHKHYVLGIQANMWPAIPQEVKDINVQNFPRLLAVAEVGWIAKGERDYANFQKRLKTQYSRLDELKIDYYREGGYITGTWTPDKLSTTYSNIEWDVTKKVYANGRINAAFFYTKGENFMQIQKVELLEDSKVISVDEHDGLADKFRGTHKTKTFFYALKVDSYKPLAKYTIRAVAKGKDGVNSYGNFTFNLNPYKPFSIIEPK